MKLLKALGFSGLCLYATLPTAHAQTTWNAGKCDASIAISGGNLTVTSSQASTWRSCYATSQGIHTGKLYFRIKVVSADASSGWMGGIGNAASPTNTYCGGGTGAASGISVQQRAGGNQIYMDGSVQGSSAAVAANNDYLVIAADFGANKYWATPMTAAGVLNTSWNNGANSPAAGTGGISIAAINDGTSMFPCFSGFTASAADVGTLDVTTTVSDSTLTGFTLWTATSASTAGSLLLMDVGH